jgi:hypothetical protein
MWPRLRPSLEKRLGLCAGSTAATDPGDSAELGRPTLSALARPACLYTPPAFSWNNSLIGISEIHDARDSSPGSPNNFVSLCF